MAGRRRTPNLTRPPSESAVGMSGEESARKFQRIGDGAGSVHKAASQTVVGDVEKVCEKNDGTAKSGPVKFAPNGFGKNFKGEL